MLRLRDIMTTDVLTLDPETTIREAMELLAARHVSGVPVVSGRRVLGVVSSTDLLGFAAGLPGVPTERTEPEVGDDGELDLEPDDEADGGAPGARFYEELWADAGADVAARFAATDGPEWDALGEHTVAEAMTRGVHALPPDADVVDAAELMGRLGAHRLLVVADDALVGIVTSMDVTRAVADRRIGHRTYVFGARGAFDGRRWT